MIDLKTSHNEQVEGAPKAGVSKIYALIPLLVFLALAGIFYKQLAGGGASRDLPSALIGKPAPIVDLGALEGLLVEGTQVPALSGEIYKGKISVVNVFASWCGPCRVEHPQFMALSNLVKSQPNIQLVGLNYKDASDNALRFLGELGNPYSVVGVDPKGRASIEWGVYGVPETYVVGPDAIIRFKHVGPISPAILQEKVLPLIESLNNQAS
ncbi:MAG: DsbE family thiol:disulfide interchange protein [Nitratireductor sp.]